MTLEKLTSLGCNNFLSFHLGKITGNYYLTSMHMRTWLILMVSHDTMTTDYSKKWYLLNLEVSKYDMKLNHAVTTLKWSDWWCFNHVSKGICCPNFIFMRGLDFRRRVFKLWAILSCLTYDPRQALGRTSKQSITKQTVT